MEFVSKFFYIVCETVGSTTPGFSEFGNSKQSITSGIGHDMEDTELLTPI
jgi:hypothetical protein